jgi:hypothetical protein
MNSYAIAESWKMSKQIGNYVSSSSSSSVQSRAPGIISGPASHAGIPPSGPQAGSFGGFQGDKPHFSFVQEGESVRSPPMEQPYTVHSEESTSLEGLPRSESMKPRVLSGAQCYYCMIRVPLDILKRFFKLLVKYVPLKLDKATHMCAL